MKKFTSKFIAVCALFFLTTSSSLAFLDVPQGVWYEEAVNYLRDEGIFDDADYFRPGDKATRAEAAKIIAETIGLLESYVPPELSPYSDVSEDAWYYPSITALTEAEMVSGDTDAQDNLTGSFRPNDYLERSEVSKMLVKAFGLPEEDLPKNLFPDVQDESIWYYEYVNTLWGWGIIDGYDAGPEAGSFGPGNDVLRAELAQMIFKLIQPMYRDERPTPEPTPTPEPEPTPEPDPLPEPPEAEEIFVPNSTNLSPRLIGGNEMHLAASYHLQGGLEALNVQRLTVVNDTTGNTLGDDPEGSIGVNKIMLKYPNKEGALRTAEASLLNDGTASFSNLELFIPRNETTPLEIYVQTNSFAQIGPQLSGESLRLGVQEVNNTSDTFRAIGEASSGTYDTPSFSSKEREVLVIRKGGPLLIQTLPVDEFLSNGTQDLIRLNLQSQASASLGRMVFSISVSDADNADLILSDFKVRQGSTLVEEAMIYDATGGQNLSLGSLTDGTSVVIVSFDQEQILSSTGETFTVEADVSGVHSDDQVSIQLITDFNPLSGLIAENRENTGKIYVSGDPTAGIFTAVDSDFSQLAGNNRHLIWSDRSAGPHSSPHINGGVVTDNSGSADWTNGYLLNMSEVDTQFLVR